MKFLPLVWSNLWRQEVPHDLHAAVDLRRVPAVRHPDDDPRRRSRFGVEIAGLDRLVLIHKVSLIMPLPMLVRGAPAAPPKASTLVTHNTWFGGIYQDPSNFFAQMAVEPEPFLKIYPEFKLPPDQMKAWLADRQGAIVGVDLAKRFGWKIGDRIPLQGTIWQPKQGQVWEFNIVGIYDGDARRRQDAVLLPLRLPRREPRVRARAWSAGTS